MTEVLRRAAKNGWPVYEWCWRETSAGETGWLSQTEVEMKRLSVTAAMWAVEYDLQEPSPQSRAIDPQKIQVMFDYANTIEAAPGRYYEIEPPVWLCSCPGRETYQPGRCEICGTERKLASYATGADWARKQDYTVIVTLRTDVRPTRLVAFYRAQRYPWPEMVRQFEYQVQRYDSIAGHDATGLGDVITGYMGVRAEAVVLSGRLRQDILTSYIAAIENGELYAPAIQPLEGEHRYASVDDLYGAGHLPDTICAMSIAYWIGSRPRGVFIG